MPQKGDRRRGKPLNPDLGYSGDPVHHATSNLPSQRIGIRELRQHASVYVDLVERGYTVDITNRGRLVAQMVPVRDPESPLERWIAKGVIERAEDDGSVLEIEPYLGPGGRPHRERRARAAAGGRGRRQRRDGAVVIYLDSSALVKLALSEPESAALTSYLATRRARISSRAPCTGPRCCAPSGGPSRARCPAPSASSAVSRSSRSPTTCSTTPPPRPRPAWAPRPRSTWSPR